jgi:sialate O-acetylesterase
MVLQRNKPNTFWGWTTPGEEVTVSVAGKKATGQAGADGRWVVNLMPPKAGGPYRVLVEGSIGRETAGKPDRAVIDIRDKKSAVLEDVLVGDVWLCTGQSNMEFGLSQSLGGQAEVGAANQPNLRLFMVPRQVGYAPKAVNGGEWRVCNSKTVAQDGWGGFSAVGYHFGRKLQTELGVPIGLVEDCWGGTSAEAWTGAKGLSPLGDFAPQLAQVESLQTSGGPVFGTYNNLWMDQYDPGRREGWQASSFDDSDWASTNLPGGPAGTRRVVWLRKTVDVPASGPATLYLNRIDDTDTTWVNGNLAGTTGFDWAWRRYPVTLQPGRNVIAVRVFTGGQASSFLGGADQMYLDLSNGSHVSLAGEWKTKVSFDPVLASSKPRDMEPNPTVPTVLYNGMIAPLAPLAIRGVIWYQGETNAGRGAQYRRLLPAMIADWRRAFGQGDFPFYIVSLANFMARDPNPGDDYWAELRDAQAFTAATVPHSGLAVAIDVGEANDVHPKDKKTVGERLAANALAKEYGRKIEYSGPIFKAAKREGGGFRLSFEHAGGLKAKGVLAGFAVAGSDRKWHWATGKIESGSVLVSSSEVMDPVAVRYAWGHNPAATLYNGAGFPAVPFRSDDWPLLSANSK